MMRRANNIEIIGSPSQEKTILEKKIDELRAFERGYRTRLKTYLDAQLRELGGMELGRQQTRCTPSKAWWAPGSARTPKRDLGNNVPPTVPSSPNTAGAGRRVGMLVSVAGRGQRRMHSLSQ
ncbi:MAG TPA: hypothetical protein VGL88_03170 [Pseudonocardiaceae bacterium]